VFETILAMSLIEKVFLTFALCGTVVFTIRMILMFSGLLSADTDGEIGHDAPDAAGEIADDVHDDISHDIAVDSDADHSGDMTDSSDHDGHTSSSDVSFHFISVQGLTAFFMMFGWVGLALIRDSMMPGWIATIGGVAAGCVMVWVLAQMFKFVGRLQSDGTARLGTAMGTGGTVYLRIPAEGSGQVQVEVDGRLRVCDAVSSKKEEIKTGEQITVVWIQDNGILVVEKDTREEGGKLCGR
jgi:membrane protein implicated in regulation of membrane protease activity